MSRFGLSFFSCIYNRFGSKEGLFLRALDHYLSEVIDERITNILNKGSVLEGIENFFSTTFESVPVQDLIGCLLTNTTMDKQISDKQIRSAVRKGIRRIEKAIERRLQDGKLSGEISADIELKSTAIHLVSCFQGLLVLGRLTGDKKCLRIVTEQAINSLR